MRDFSLMRNSNCYFFFSFGDAFAYLAKHFDFQSNEYILIPDLYCPDTVVYFSSFLKVLFYKINQDLTVNKDDYFAQIRKHSPKVILNYCFWGFVLSVEEKKQLKKLCGSSTVIIEDYAQRFINQSELEVLLPNHYYLDSVRKIVLVLGAHLCSPSIQIDKRIIQNFNCYKIRNTFCWLLLQIFDFLFYCFGLDFLRNLSDLLLEKLNKSIGNSHFPTSGWKFFELLYQSKDINKVKQRNRSTIELYIKYFNKLRYIPSIRLLNQEIIRDAALQYGFPVLIDTEFGNRLIDYLSKKRIYPFWLWAGEYSKFCKQNLNLPLLDNLMIFPIKQIVGSIDVKQISQEVLNFYLFEKANGEKI